MKSSAALVTAALLITPALASKGPWELQIDQQVALLGHRNMIIIADSAYPIQTGAGVKVIATGAAHKDVVAYATKAITDSPAVRPLIALDKEFFFVPDKRAPGATELRKSILAMLEGKSAAPIREELHETLLKEVNELATEYTVVVFKTTGVIPYSSVFFTLDCGYWGAEDEAAMRAKMEK